MTKPTLLIYWSRRDLRTLDNPALTAAVQHSVKDKIPMLPLFVLEDFMLDGAPDFQFGYPSRYFLSQALPEFAKEFHNFTILKGKGANSLIDLAKDYTLTVYVNEDVHPFFYKQLHKLKEKNIDVHLYRDQLTIRKDIRTSTDKIYSVFTPYKKASWTEFMNVETVAKIDPKQAHPTTESIPNSVDIQNLEKLFSPDRTMMFDGKILDLEPLVDLPTLDMWYWSEQEAQERFDAYLESGMMSEYGDNRNSLELDVEESMFQGTKFEGKTSRMSLALTWGLISARTLRDSIKQHYKQHFADPFGGGNKGALMYLSELVWREFYKYVLFHRPDVLDTEYQEKFRNLNWITGEEAKKRFLAWITGTTGYPAVDASMRQIASIGWMHNRSRMLVSSILTKNLGIDWRAGQEYFRAALIDWDEASNNGGWQWGASTGADPKPIRIFNPFLQAKNYDSSGSYQKRWLPKNYDYQQMPLVDHKLAREDALKRYRLDHTTEARDY